MLAIQIVMPSEGDMILVKQEGGAVMLQPVFYGKECAGPHIQILDVDKAGKILEVKGRARLKISVDGKLEIKKGTLADEVEEAP